DVINKDGVPLYKLVSRDGKPLSDKEAAQRTYEPMQHGPFTRPKSRDEALKEAAAFVDDLVRVMEFRILRRENMRSRSAIVIACSARKNVTPQTRVGKMVLSRSEGMVWIDETDHVVARLQSRFTEDFSYGTSVLAKVYKGTEVVRDWLKFRDEVWLPAGG